MANSDVPRRTGFELSGRCDFLPVRVLGLGDVHSSRNVHNHHEDIRVGELLALTQPTTAHR